MAYKLFTESNLRGNKKMLHVYKWYILKKKGFTHQKIADMYKIKHRQQIQKSIKKYQIKGYLPC